MKCRVAILGTGNIGTDLLVKALRSSELECGLFSGRNLGSAGMAKAAELGVALSSRGIDGILEHADEIDLVFDATSALDHERHAPMLAAAGIVAVDLTPARVGRMCVPAVNLEACIDLPNVNMVTCGGQASIPLAFAIQRANPRVRYVETVSSIASRSAGPATRINLDEYLMTTEAGLSLFSGCDPVVFIQPRRPGLFGTGSTRAAGFLSRRFAAATLRTHLSPEPRWAAAASNWPVANRRPTRARPPSRTQWGAGLPVPISTRPLWRG